MTLVTLGKLSWLPDFGPKDSGTRKSCEHAYTKSGNILGKANGTRLLYSGNYISQLVCE